MLTKHALNSISNTEHNLKIIIIIAIITIPLLLQTRKLCYRKDDRAMHPTHGRPENFWDSLTTPRLGLLFPTFFDHGLLFRSTL